MPTAAGLLVGGITVAGSADVGDSLVVTTLLWCVPPMGNCQFSALTPQLWRVSSRCFLFAARELPLRTTYGKLIHWWLPLTNWRCPDSFYGYDRTS